MGRAIPRAQDRAGTPLARSNQSVPVVRHLAARLYLQLAPPDACGRRNLAPHRRFDSLHVQINPSDYAGQHAQGPAW